MEDWSFRTYLPLIFPEGNSKTVQNTIKNVPQIIVLFLSHFLEENTSYLMIDSILSRLVSQVSEISLNHLFSEI